MNYQTLEVELENGQVRPRSTERLPDKARALLTILTPAPDTEALAGSLADRVSRFAGIGCGEHADLSTNKEHLDDLGR